MTTNANTQHEGNPDNDDVITDPAFDDNVGTDWTDEGGATPSGPATSTVDNAETEQSKLQKRFESEPDSASDGESGTGTSPAIRPSHGDS